METSVSFSTSSPCFSTHFGTTPVWVCISHDVFVLHVWCVQGISGVELIWRLQALRNSTPEMNSIWRFFIEKKDDDFIYSYCSQLFLIANNLQFIDLSIHSILLKLGLMLRARLVRGFKGYRLEMIYRPFFSEILFLFDFFHRVPILGSSFCSALCQKILSSLSLLQKERL